MAFFIDDKDYEHLMHVFFCANTDAFKYALEGLRYLLGPENGMYTICGIVVYTFCGLSCCLPDVCHMCHLYFRASNETRPCIPENSAVTSFQFFL